MAFKDNQVGQLVRTDPASASLAISASLKICDGFLAPTAKALGANEATLKRWIGKLRAQGYPVEPLRGRGERTEQGVAAAIKGRWPDGPRRRSKPPPKKPRKTGARKKKFAKRA